MSAHTPGPWNVGAIANDLMAGKPGGRFHGIDSENHGALAVVVTQMEDDYPPGSSCERLMANARLIAAAPELLAALQELLDIEGPQPGTSEWAMKASAAVSKATGTAPAN